MGAVMAIFPLVILVLTAFVAYGRWKLAPLGEAPHERELVPNS